MSKTFNYEKFINYETQHIMGTIPGGDTLILHTKSEKLWFSIRDGRDKLLFENGCLACIIQQHTDSKK